MRGFAGGNIGKRIFDDETSVRRDAQLFGGAQLDFGMRFGALDFVAGNDDCKERSELVLL